MLRKTMLLTVCCCLLGVSVVAAQSTVEAAEEQAADSGSLDATTSPPADDGDEVEVTLFLGLLVSDSLDSIGPGAKLDFDEDLDLGLSVALATSFDGFQVEILYSRNRMDLTADRPGQPRLAEIEQRYLHVGGLWELNDGPRRGFATASVGIVKLDPEGTTYAAKTLPSVGLGGGGKFVVSDHVGFRVEGRLLGHVGGRSIFCAPASCLGQVSGSLLMQFQAAVGLTVRF